MGIFPFAGVLSAVLVVFIGVVGQMLFTHIVATLLQIGVAFMMYFTISNFTSIVAPIGMAVGTMKPVSMKLSIAAIQFAAVLLTPLTLLPAAVALGAESLAHVYGGHVFGGVQAIPIYLLLTLVELPLTFWFYTKMLTIQGRHLQQREQVILEIVSDVAD